MSRFFSAEQDGTSEGWTAEVISGADDQDAAENFCADYVMEGSPPYRVNIRDEWGEETHWKVSPSKRPVYDATPRKS